MGARGPLIIRVYSCPFVVKKSFQAPSECPVCGAAVPRGARACPECGADERSGWNEDDTRYDGLGLPDEAFGDDTAARGPRRRMPRSGLHPLWVAAGAVTLLALILIFVFRR